MSKKVKSLVDLTTEEKIKEAARKLFTQKGFDAVKTRDIAAEAGINLALLNYYFRSKEKLFEIIMVENMQEFLRGLSVMTNDENKSIDDLIEKFADNYTIWLTKNPDLFFFILNEIKQDPKSLGIRLDSLFPDRPKMRKKLMGMMKAEKMTDQDIFNLMSNMIGLIVTPFILKHLLQGIGDGSEKQFNERLEERKKLIPLWLKAMKGVK
jgi:AcrR family transcriptional regulator